MAKKKRAVKAYRVARDPMIKREHRLAWVVEYHVRYVLNACSWNKSRAAKVLGINRRTLQRFEKKLMRNYNRGK